MAGAGAGAPTSSREFANPQLASLDLYVGTWDVAEEHYDARGHVVATVQGAEEITWILDQHAIRRTYTTSTESRVFRAIGTLTWNKATQQYRGVWFDNVSTTGPTRVTGAWSPDTLTMVFTLESLADDGSTVRYKVVERFLDEERRLATTYLLKGSEVVKRLEVHYKRTIPCPDRLRIVFDELLEPEEKK